VGVGGIQDYRLDGPAHGFPEKTDLLGNGEEARERGVTDIDDLAMPSSENELIEHRHLALISLRSVTVVNAGNSPWRVVAGIEVERGGLNGRGAEMTRSCAAKSRRPAASATLR
jgi:hypothetical protein